MRLDGQRGLRRLYQGHARFDVLSTYFLITCEALTVILNNLTPGALTVLYALQLRASPSAAYPCVMIFEPVLNEFTFIEEVSPPGPTIVSRVIFSSPF